MLIGLIHKGSGMGDQLFSYIATRVRDLDLGVGFGFVGKEYFKGKDFMNLDWGSDTRNPNNGFDYRIDGFSGKLIPILRKPRQLFEINKPYYDPEFNFIPDGSVIDGYGAQDIRYFEHRLDEVREWLKPDKEYNFYDDEDDKKYQKCIINFRGGEFQAVPKLFLPKEYWQQAMDLMKNKYPKIEFEVHTDDREAAIKMFPELQKSTGIFPILVGIGMNWKSILYAKHLIISNSAFAILPALLNENVKEVIAPKFWAGRNVGEWRRPQNYYSKFTYIQFCVILEL